MNRTQIEYVEDSSELDPHAPGVWALGSFSHEDSEAALADAVVVQIHVRGERRPHRTLHLRRSPRSRRGRQCRVRQAAASVC